MRQSLALLASGLLLLAGCMSAPVPPELIPAAAPPAPSRLLLKDIVRLSQAGIADDLIIELIERHPTPPLPSLDTVVALKERGVRDPVLRALMAKPPQPPPPPAKKEALVYREFSVPLWPNYSRGGWHLGFRGAWFYGRAGAAELPELPEDLDEEYRPLRKISP